MVVKVENKEVKSFKLDLGCGPRKKEGFFGVDSMQFDGVDLVLDLSQSVTPMGQERKFAKWPWEDNSVDEAYSSHFLEHLTGTERIHFFNELGRVMKPKAQAQIIVPAWSSERAYGDPTHQWPPVVGFAFYYLNADWRKGNAPHVGYTCDFDFMGGNGVANDWNLKSPEVRGFAERHYMNVAQDMFITITKRGN